MLQSPNNPSCTDLFSTNQIRSIQNTTIIEPGLFDFHKIVITIMKIYLNKQKARIIQYKSYANFWEGSCKTNLSNEFLRIDINKTEFSNFDRDFLSVLDKHKTNYVMFEKIILTFSTKIYGKLK